MAESFAQFIHMGGYADYVWSSYGLALLVIAGNMAWPWLRHRRMRQRILNEDYDD